MCGRVAGHPGRGLYAGWLRAKGSKAPLCERASGGGGGGGGGRVGRVGRVSGAVQPGVSRRTWICKAVAGHAGRGLTVHGRMKAVNDVVNALNSEFMVPYCRQPKRQGH